MREYLEQQIRIYEHMLPPTSDFAKGYLAALEDALAWLTGEERRAKERGKVL